jgi:hypothetical protein
VQVRSLIQQLSMLVARQRHVANVIQSDNDATELDREVAETDELAKAGVVDVLRHGWRAGAELLVRQAFEAGFLLRVGFEPSAVGSADLVRRALALRQAYNRLPVAREAVDRFVSATAPRLMIRSQPGTPESIQTTAKQFLDLGSIRYYLAQAERDAFVLGNGYVAFVSDPRGVYNLRPEEAVPQGDELVLPRPGESPVRALHLTGMRQPGSLLGLGLLELALPALQQQEMFERITARAKQFESSPDPVAVEWAKKSFAMAERGAKANEQNLRDIFSPLLTLLPDPIADLYFSGFELM